MRRAGLLCIVLLALFSLAPSPAVAEERAAAPVTAGKERVYKFDALDIEGNVDKPRLLYFLNRVRAELGAARARKRSFLPELRETEAAAEL